MEEVLFNSFILTDHIPIMHKLCSPLKTRMNMRAKLYFIDDIRITGIHSGKKRSLLISLIMFSTSE